MDKDIKVRSFVIAFFVVVLIIGIGVCVFQTVRHPKNKDSHLQDNTTFQDTLESTGSTSHIHNYIAEIIPATCENPGHTLHSCACGDAYQADAVSANGHTYGEWEVVLEATVEAEGEKKKSCTVCGNKIIETIPKREAPANEMGTTEATNSSENKTSETPPKKEGNVCSWACSLGSFTTILEPTTTSTGLQVAYCEKCGKEFIDEIPRLISPEKLEGVDPRITIVKNVADSIVSYKYKGMSVWDSRSWGAAPIIVITEEDYLDVSYFKQDGSKVNYVLRSVEDAAVWITIREDGTYIYNFFDGFENMDGSGD